MMTIRTANLNNRHAGLHNCAIAAAGLIALTLAAFAPGNSHARSFHIESPEDLLEELIAMDARDIDELQGDLQDARKDIADAILDIEDAKEDVRDVPGGRAIARVAMRTASAAVSSATGEALSEAWDALNSAEAMLSDQRDEVGEAEFRETQGAIDMIRGELEEIEYALDSLMTALREA